ncbi:hypothetical protein GUITHDRAFT_78760 [Guillardia theta CCMP2712]|uniref:Orn/DAP/Arg decarboxylase 2 N-terminal domain-containing protein n=1 Tax=Guillardia theta (strain CCMP2712) TaxID=905079 RepID=L1IK55_GUITC|nr:hypothetical protein GUITHDRAFT_78760 [Guillardia theta CCMP2712]EKX36633.1 hypothetical protein GUITHDRAFT_78760 [Guillardia theta CCMP2712]|eukprot:XP_005823613.1 hypothetical protein GUITHDRAFT_78760 [Guillardia theta CCMP2712]
MNIVAIDEIEAISETIITPQQVFEETIPVAVIQKSAPAEEIITCDDDWGVSKFVYSNSIDGILAENKVRVLPAGYNTAELILDISAESEEQDPFYIVDLTTVLTKLDDWKTLMPRVKPFYAMKCNNDGIICKMLCDAGCGFDCASKAEIEAALQFGVLPDHIIYANPCKQESMLRYARSVGVKKMTADNVEELHKIANCFPEAKVVLRIAVDDSKSVCRFNSKFGAAQHEWDVLLRTAKALDLDVAGFSFHVGSGCGDLKPFADAVAAARDAFDQAEAYGFSPSILDCGGGFPGTNDGAFSFHEVASTISNAIDHFFPPSCGVQIIAEPGRYMVAASHTYSVSVIAKRQLTAAQLADKEVRDSNTPEVALYINDGCYGSFNCIVFDHAIITPKVLGTKSALPFDTPSKLFGPTCDSIDVVMPCTLLPQLDIGDWIWFPNMGAYTRCAASRFNGQGAFNIHYVWAGVPSK